MISVTPSEIIQYLYCPRFIYFEHVLSIPQNEEKYFKAMQGRYLHDQKSRINKDYLRKSLGVLNKYQEQYMTNPYLRGQVDEVLELNDGKMAPLDYKFAKYEQKIYSTYKTQLACYALLIEDNYGKSVDCGYLVYTRSKNKLIKVDISKSDKKRVIEAAKQIGTIIRDNYFPKATSYKKRCNGCTYSPICLK